ncbi:MAG: FAD-binding oxidoreductase [Caldilineae bacterium]|nr:FAD-binding oxidoreductase [Chloroflexota bacterium]MCB9177091.1 FAD-binding oxidoreductase [Caldilineae bacterium]
MSRYESWGRYPRAQQRRVLPAFWRGDPPALDPADAPYLPYGLGRSYGDCCLNADGTLIDARPLSRFIAFDAQAGRLTCEAGVSLAEILNLIVPRGWFPPVTPGTKFITVGGAIANDVHGKNHHRAGTFGRYVRRFELLRSDGRRLLCSPDENAELYAATIGGLGLTGLILWAELELKPIPGPQIELEAVRCRSLAEFVDRSLESDASDEYTAGWIDGLSRGGRLGRGVLLRGNHARGDGRWRGVKPSPLRLPFDAPGFALNPLGVEAFNALYYRVQQRKERRALAGYGAFFYPLDVVHNWNRAYGRRGFLQWQCVVPHDDGARAASAILERLGATRRAWFVVGKVFGDLPSPGMLSFPRPGLTLAIDLPNDGPRVFEALDAVDRIVLEVGGALYPAKDARMAPATFRAGFPRWREFARQIDPAFSSSLWRRLTHDEAPA